MTKGKARTEREVLVPIGMSGNCVELFESLDARFHIPAILDDAAAGDGASFKGVPILPLSHAARFAKAWFLCLIGSPRSFRDRRAIIARIGMPTARYARVVHPRASVSRMARIGHGTALWPGVLVTSNATIGAHVLVLPRAIMHHDVAVGDYTLIGAGVIVAGGVQIGEGCYVGSGSVVRDGVRIGDGALVGIGSVVIRDVPPGAVVAGNPARPLGTTGG